LTAAKKFLRESGLRIANGVAVVNLAVGDAEEEEEGEEEVDGDEVVVALDLRVIGIFLDCPVVVVVVIVDGCLMRIETGKGIGVLKGNLNGRKKKFSLSFSNPGVGKVGLLMCFLKFSLDWT
jgi:hypothetical protein